MNHYVPHGYCILWDVPLLVSTIAGHLGIFVAYMGIPYLLHRGCKARGIAFPLDRLFMAFIVLCGIGHAIEIVQIWKPWYWFGAIWGCLTAAVSLACSWKLKGHLAEWLQMLTWPEEMKRLSETVEELQRRLEAATGESNG